VSRALDALLIVLAGLVVADLFLWWWRPEETFLLLLGAVGLRALLGPSWMPAWRPARVVAAGVAAYALVFSFIALTRHWAFRTHALDLGYYVQLLWSIAAGRGARVSLPEMHAWGDHFSPTLYLLVPLFALFPRAELLLVAQSAVFALGALPLFALARRRLGEDRPAAAFALLYLVSPTLHGINLRDFHIAAFAIPLLLWALACWEAGRTGWFLLAVVLALGCREDAALAVLGLGAWLALARRRWTWGLALAAGSLAVLVLDLHVLMPYFRGEPYPHLHRYAHLGGSLGEIVLGMLAHPLRTLGFMASLEKLGYLLALLAPLGFLPLLAPWELIPALPTLVHNLVSLDPVLFHHRTQYNAYILPFLFWAAVGGYARLPAWRTLGGRPARGLLLGLGVLVSLALTARTLNDLAVRRWHLDERQRAAHRLLARVPPDASVSAWDRFAAHLATRPEVFVFPVGAERADVVVVDAGAPFGRAEREGRLMREGGKVRITVPTPEGVVERAFEIVEEGAGYLLLRGAGG
jgi:uncharacterized membrane protein